MKEEKVVEDIPMALKEAQIRDMADYIKNHGWEKKGFDEALERVRMIHWALSSEYAGGEGRDKPAAKGNIGALSHGVEFPSRFLVFRFIFIIRGHYSFAVVGIHENNATFSGITSGVISLGGNHYLRDRRKDLFGALGFLEVLHESKGIQSGRPSHDFGRN